MMYFFIIALLLIVILAVILLFKGYLVTKKEYSDFVNRTLSDLPINKEEINQIEIKKQDSKIVYFITFEDSGINTTHLVSEEILNVVYDLKVGENPYIQFKYLYEDVAFEDNKGYILEHGVYDVEIHVTKDILNELKDKKIVSFIKN